MEARRQGREQRGSNQETGERPGRAAAREAEQDRNAARQGNRENAGHARLLPAAQGIHEGQRFLDVIEPQRLHRRVHIDEGTLQAIGIEGGEQPDGHQTRNQHREAAESA